MPITARCPSLLRRVLVEPNVGVSFLVRVTYFADALLRRVAGSDSACPDCGSRMTTFIQRKYLVTELRRCEACRLQFRMPTERVADQRAFYDSRRYSQGFTTELPDDDTLERLKASRFVDSDRSYAPYGAVLRALGLPRAARIFEFGCSWGYGAWQLSEWGYDVTAYELSNERADFAREKLGIRCVAAIDDLAGEVATLGPFDVFFSAHVVEHVPQPRAIIQLARQLVRPGGYFVAFTPNGSAPFRRQAPDAWRALWGKVHPNMLDDHYWRAAFQRQPLLLDCTPADLQRVTAFAAGVETPEPPLDRVELLCLARL